MTSVKNIFGEGMIYSENDLIPPIFSHCCACTSVFSEWLSWANAYPEKITPEPASAKSIVILSCQVTDLAVLNDINKLRYYLSNYPDADVFVGGCLARRFDIALPSQVKRLENVRKDYQEIKESRLALWDKPFWVPDFKENDTELADGHIFRDMYPLRISVGCYGKCSYCTIRSTRGKPYELLPEQQIKEFLNNEDVLLIADNPSASLLRSWCKISVRYKKQISIRNIEPTVLCMIKEDLFDLAAKHLLRICHCPVQSLDKNVLAVMRRDPQKTMMAVEIMKKLKSLGVVIATNVIIAYPIQEKESTKKALSVFDYVSWNPYWDGRWNESIAKERFERFIISNNNCVA